jgi:hypothetical protein
MKELFMFHWLLFPFQLLGALIHAVLWLVMLPFTLLFKLLGLALFAVGLGIKLALWSTCVVLSLIIANKAGLNPILCAFLAAFLGPIGLLIVIGLALLRRPVRI